MSFPSPMVENSSRPTGGRRMARPVVILLAAAALVAVGCSARTAATAGGGSPDAGGPARIPVGTLNIVAGENFWGSLVAQLAGRAGNVTSIVSDPNADPHTYQSSSSNARAFATADYVVLNGAGYDAWADQLISGNPNAKRKVFTVATLLGRREGDNPHFWYNPAYVTQVVNQIESDLKSLDPADAAYFGAQRTALDQAFTPYLARLAEIKSQFAGRPVASTESIFVYLAQYLGLNLISPPEFMKAVAEGNDPPAPSVAAFQSQLTAKQAGVLVYNLQTATDVTSNLKKLAAQAGIPTVGVTETIQPPDATFEQWFGAELQALQNGLNANALSQ